MPELSVEERATVDGALEAIAAYGLAGSRASLPAAPLGDEAWTSFVREVAHERLVGLLGAAMSNGAFPATDDQVGETAELQDRVAVHALLLERLLLNVADDFARCDLDFRVLKGSATANLDYSDPSLRSFGDVDLLVGANDFARAVVCLEAAGGRRRVPELRRGFDRRFGKGAVIDMPGDLEIDLHRTFVAGPFAMKIDGDNLFAMSEPFVLGDRTLFALGREERFLHACVHAGLGRPARLHSLRDVAETVLRADLDVDRVHRLADEWGAGVVVSRAVGLAWTTLGIADCVALSAWAGSYRPSAAEKRLLRAYLGGDQSYTRQALAAFREIRRGRDKLAFAGSLLFPRRRYLQARGAGRVAFLRRGASRVLQASPR